MHLEFKAGVTAALFGLSVAAFAEPLHIEPGLWDVTYSYSLQGQPPPSVLAKMTPEKRAEMEKKWAERKGQTKTNASKACVTAEELAKGTAFENDDDAQKEGCRRTVNTQTAARWTVVEHCDTDTGPSERNVEIIANRRARRDRFDERGQRRRQRGERAEHDVHRKVGGEGMRRRGVAA